MFNRKIIQKTVVLLSILAIGCSVTSCGSYRRSAGVNSGDLNSAVFAETSSTVTSGAVSSVESNSESIAPESTTSISPESSSAPESSSIPESSSAPISSSAPESSSAPASSSSPETSSIPPTNPPIPDGQTNDLSLFIWKNAEDSKIQQAIGTLEFSRENEGMHAYHYSFGERNNPEKSVITLEVDVDYAIRALRVEFSKASEMVTVGGINKNDTPESIVQKLGKPTSQDQGSAYDNCSLILYYKLRNQIYANFYFDDNGKLDSASTFEYGGLDLN